MVPLSSLSRGTFTGSAIAAVAAAQHAAALTHAKIELLMPSILAAGPRLSCRTRGSPAGRRFVMAAARTGGTLVSPQKGRTAHVRRRRNSYSDFTGKRLGPPWTADVASWQIT
ncbi:hypothetical protein GmRootV59_37600 [Variovorax sp. V59]